jgi:penicillin-binding protein A
VNGQIAKLFVVLAALLVALVAMTGYWQVWAAPSLASRQDNLREVVREQSIERGLILARDGTRLAANRRSKTGDGRTVYVRRYPAQRLFAHVVGYSSPTANRSGLERSQNDYLTGANSDLAGVLENQLRGLGLGVQGNDLITTLDTAVQREAMFALAESGLKGAIAAIEPATGRVLALASWPSYDPNLAVRGGRGWQAVQERDDGVLLGRATQGRYPPGSTFKLVTLAAALESGRFTPSSRFVDRGFFVQYGQRISNAGGAVYGAVDLRYALTKSINSVFAEIGATLCPTSRCPALAEQMERFGFFAPPPVELPSDEVVASGLQRPGTSDLQGPTDPIDPARTAIGQYTVVATPLQMAMVSAAIANGGILMRPTLIREVRKRSGEPVSQREPEEYSRAISPQTAATMTTMMTDVVNEGTGVAAALDGISVAGKTGTAETGRGGLNDAWFVAFAPVEAPRIALAVVLEDTTGFGGTAAAPIARRVLEAALQSG